MNHYTRRETATFNTHSAKKFATILTIIKMRHYCGFSSCPSVVCKVKLEHKKYSNNASFYYFIVINIILVYVLHDVTQKKNKYSEKALQKIISFGVCFTRVHLYICSLSVALKKVGELLNPVGTPWLRLFSRITNSF